MNLGASHASGSWLLFLHADSTLPAEWLDHILAVPADVCGAWFQFRLDDGAWQARVIERGVAVRVRLKGGSLWSCNFAIRRETFEQLRGFPELPIMEDVAFVRRLQRCGLVIELPLPLATSARRWRRDGWIHRSARNMTLLLLYAAGVSPSRLARHYQRPER